MGELLVILGGLLIFALILAAVLYLVGAIGLCGMGKNAGIEESWLAFIPILQGYVWGKIIKEIKIANYVIPKAEIVLPVSSLTFGLFGNGIIGSLLCLCAVVINIVALYQLYSLYKKPNEVSLYMVISIIFPIAIPFIFFSLRDKSPLNMSETKSA